MSKLKAEKGQVERKLMEAQERVDSIEVEREIEKQERDRNQGKEHGSFAESKTKVKEMERELEDLRKELQFEQSQAGEKDEELKDLLGQITELKEFRLEQQKDNKALEVQLQKTEGEIKIAHGQAKMYEDQNQQLTAEIHQMREELSKADQNLFQSNANSDLQLREIQMLKSLGRSIDTAVPDNSIKKTNVSKEQNKEPYGLDDLHSQNSTDRDQIIS